MLSTIFLVFEDREMRMTFEKTKREYYGRILLILWPMLILLTAGLIVLDVLEQFDSEMMTHIVNGSGVFVFFLLWVLVRKYAICSWFVCPLLTAFAFYYFAIVDYDGTAISIYYTMIVGITSSLFILVMFNESWLLSTVVYAPLLAYYMYKTGDDMNNGDSEMNELIIRCVFCVFLYLIIAYKVEMLNKQAFLGQ